MSILRKKCCCAGTGEPVPTTCVCTGCPSAHLVTFSGQLSIEFVSGTFLQWQYSNASAIIETFGGCGGAQSQVGGGQMGWEANPPASGCSASGSCPLSGWGGLNVLIYPLVGIACGVTLLNPQVAAFGIGTPTYWVASINPIPQKYKATGGVYCPCNWVENAEYGEPVSGLSLYWPRLTTCPTGISTPPAGILLWWLGGSYPVAGASGQVAIPGGTATIGGGVVVQ